MAIINFSKVEKDAITQKIQLYFSKELNQEIGSFDAGFLLNYFSEEIGPYFYNMALHDAQTILNRRMEDISSAIDELTKPIGPKK
jgi:uncharacterized protein (DUF2164 family)